MPRTPAIREVVVDRKVYDRFRKRAFKAYPLEHAEQVWGLVEKGRAHIHCFEPIDLLYQNRAGVDFDFDQPCGTERNGLTLLGSIHTHPPPFDTSPSDADISTAAEDGELVWGICAIRKTAKRRFAACRFWSGSQGEIDFVVAE